VVRFLADVAIAGQQRMSWNPYWRLWVFLHSVHRFLAASEIRLRAAGDM
jgi:hypothetical protein